MLLGDIGETLKLAAAGKSCRSENASVPSPRLHAGESGGIGGTGAQLLSRTRWSKTSTTASAPRRTAPDGEVRIFSRTRDEITESFPELPDALAGLPQEAILDGEIVAWSYCRMRGRCSPASRQLRGVPPAVENTKRYRPCAPFQRAAAAPGPKAGQRKADAASACGLSRLRCALRGWRVAAGPPSPRARENSRCLAGSPEEIASCHRERAGTSGASRIRRRRQRIEHPSDSRSGISGFDAARTGSTVRSGAGARQ